jgi:hypothetical protein
LPVIQYRPWHLQRNVYPQQIWGLMQWLWMCSFVNGPSGIDVNRVCCLCWVANHKMGPTDKGMEIGTDSITSVGYCCISPRIQWPDKCTLAAKLIVTSTWEWPNLPYEVASPFWRHKLHSVLCYCSPVFDYRWEWIFFNLLNSFTRTVSLGLTQPLAELRTRNPGGKARPVRRADNFRAIRVSVV